MMNDAVIVRAWARNMVQIRTFDLSGLIEITRNCFEIVEIKKLGRLTGANVRLAARS